MAKTLLSWTEPTGFVLRLRTGKEWLKRLLQALGVAAVVFLVFHFAFPRDILVELTIALLAGVLVPLLLDLPFLFREVTITDAAIDWVADGAKIAYSGSFPHADTDRIELIRPGEWRFQFGGIRLHRPNGEWYLFAVPHSTKLETIATLLTRQEIPVTLSGWEPTTADTRTQVHEELVLADPANATRDSVFTPMPEDEPKLLPTGTRVFAVLVGAGPTLLALLAMIGTWVYLGVNWSELDWIERGVVGGAGVAGFLLGFLYLLAIGQFAETSINLAAARKGLRARLNPLVDPNDEELFPVSLYPRDVWTKVIAKSEDQGFLQVHRGKRALVFEGNKQRWTIPLTALTAVRIEEAQVGKEGASPSETRYYVVLGTFRDGEEWEIGLTVARTKWGFDGAQARRARMALLFDELHTAIALVQR